MTESNLGSTQSEIQSHYDVGNAFYKLWLGESMAYTAALWNIKDQNDTLDAAQYRKLDYHLQQANCSTAESLLDIGCGWGSILKRANEKYSVNKAVGLTLSDEQVKWINQQNLTGIEAKLEAWQDHQASAQYDSIISVGAFEHFARPEMNREEKIKHYRFFFKKCYQWLKAEGKLSLQTIAHASNSQEKQQQIDQLSQKVFPGSSLPHLIDIIEANQDLLKFNLCVEHSRHYQKTLFEWRKNLVNRRTEAIALHGEETYQHYVEYLQNSEMGFASGNLQLLRLIFEK